VNEKYDYDINSFIGEAGGSLGLFLGASVFTFYDIAEKLIKKYL
jgi:hypothetical protein